jgi:hypothetical protein
MIRFALAVIGILSLVGSAEACNRCGHYGNSCRYYAAPKYVAPVYHNNHQHHAHNYDNRETLNFIFNNSYPLPLLAQQGNSLYGYSLAAKDHSVDPQLILDRAGRLAENSQSLTSEGVSGFLAIGSQQINGQVEVAKIHAQGAAATAALQAARGDPTPAAGSLSFRAEFDSSGKLTVHPAEDGGRLSLSAGGNILKEKCASCHKSGGKAAPFKPETAEKAYTRWGQMAHHGVDVPDDMQGVIEISDEEKQAVSQALLGLSVQ